MMLNQFKIRFQKNISNIIGWNTKRKIVVIESDDWGSVRTKGNKEFESMLSAGLNIKHCIYNKFDALESNDDLEDLFNVLSEFKDKNGRRAVFTPMCIMANPDFDKIKDSDFKQYFFEPLNITIEKYPKHDKLLSLWKKGCDERIFMPGLHGREHINIHRYIELLQSDNNGFRIMLNHESIGASGYKDVQYENYLGALNPLKKNEIKSYYQILDDAGKLFKNYLGITPKCFIAPNREEPKELETVLWKIGIKYLTRAKIRKYPIGDSQFKTEFNWQGKKNNLGITILVRNAHFEPSFKNEHFLGDNWVQSCIEDMKIAFKWNKPVVISSHRANFIGFLNQENKDLGLSQLRLLLKTMLSIWPDIEFMSSEELGDEIIKNH